MKLISIFIIAFVANLYTVDTLAKDLFSYRNAIADSLPVVLPGYHADLIESKLRHEAFTKFASHRLPNSITEWESYKTSLKNEVISKMGVLIDHQLPLDIKVTSTTQIPGCIIKNIYFQTRPDIYTTANLYIPEGEGPFPGVVAMCGHSKNGRLYDGYQSVGQTLALNGYVALVMDPWGAGERTTTHGIFEYHGANLGASLMNIGESLMGMQLSDNIRGVDLLLSIPYIDHNKIGATGSSGGGNQTMWLAAIDERIKVAVPVVSVGTFESYVMGHNCICETLLDGLTFTEEAGILALANAIMPCNHIKDSNPTFSPSEMLRSYNNAKPIFKIKNTENNISYRIFDLTHGYKQEDCIAMLEWFDLKLKGKVTDTDRIQLPVNLLPAEEIMVFTKGIRDSKVISTAEYCKRKGNNLRTSYLENKSFDVLQKRKELSNILRIHEKPELKKIHKYGNIDGWERIALETSDNKLIPVLLTKPKTESLGYVIIVHSLGKKEISFSLIDELMKKGTGIVIVDLTGTGEASSATADLFDKHRKFHTLARAELWLGKTVLGEWVKELNMVAEFIKSAYSAQEISIDGTKEAGLAGLFLCSLGNNIDNIILREVPISYMFDNRESIDFFSMAIHLPGFLKWGDISLAAALSGSNITFINPVTMSGQMISNKRLMEFQEEFEKLRNICKQPGKSSFK